MHVCLVSDFSLSLQRKPPVFSDPFLDPPRLCLDYRQIIYSCCVCVQAEYEVTPDEKRKENGQEVVDRYLNSQVAALCFLQKGVSEQVSTLCSVLSYLSMFSVRRAHA